MKKIELLAGAILLGLSAVLLSMGVDEYTFIGGETHIFIYTAIACALLGIALVWHAGKHWEME
ncbi:MAG: hypothetical protein GTO18_00845 [Anaerolineales bacterium]|nr:hypothetical protein [Anaerolineales bacterium]